MGFGPGPAGEAPTLIDLEGRELRNVIFGGWQCAIQDSNTASFAAALRAAGEFDAVSEKQIMESCAGIDLNHSTEGQEFNLNPTFRVHGALW